MRKLFLFSTFFVMVALSFSCKKNKGGDGGDTAVQTLEVEYTASEDVYGNKYTFRIKFTSIGDVTEYGVVYMPWISDKADKTPKVNEPGSFKVPFGSSPSSAGTIETGQITLRYADFNDANYRAYAITDDGEVVYGEILYIVFS